MSFTSCASSGMEGIMKKILLLWLAVMGCACAAEKVSVETAEQLISKKVQLLDVRTKKEWKEGHLEGAVRADIKAEGFTDQVKKVVDSSKPVLVYCRSGRRSARAAKEMEALGYKTVYDLKGGITAWKNADKIVVK